MKANDVKGRNVAIDYLRAFITLLVLEHHSTLAYTTFAHVNFSNPLRSTAPIIDACRWWFLDYAEDFNDVFFMSLMFLLSGLCVLPSLQAKGVLSFIKDRIRRLGLVFFVGVIFLIPMAYYPAFLSVGSASNYFQFWFNFITKYGWGPGPLWFIWVLLAFDVIAAISYPIIRIVTNKIICKSSFKAFLMLFLVSFFAYAPMLDKFGFGTWIPFITIPLWFQLPRILLYLAWFLCGVFFGANCLQQGFLSMNSRFAKRWPIWVLFACIAFISYRFVPAMISGFYNAGKIRDIVRAAFWVLSCCASSFAFLSLFLGTIKARSRVFDSLARNAYLIYAVHYLFVLWAQFLLLNAPVNAATKFIVVFLITVLASWGLSSLLLRIPAIRKIA